MDIVVEIYNKYKDNPNKIISLYKSNHKNFAKILHDRTDYLNGKTLKRELSQRLYHCVNNISEIPTNKYGWYMQFLNLEDGYSEKYSEKLRDITIHDLNDDEKIAYAKSAPLRTKYIEDYIIKFTPFLKTDDIFTRQCYLRYGISEPILKNGEEIPKIYPQNLNLIKTYCEFKKDKYEFLKKWFYGEEETRRFIIGCVRECDNIIDYINELSPSFLDNDYNNIIQKLYCIFNDIKDQPKCEHCGKHIQVDQFSTSYLKYPKTCSKLCSNQYVKNIEKRLKHNNTNSSGFCTNIGKNENKILDCLEVVDRQKQVSKYFVDGIKDGVIIEINEKHHLYTRHIKKDIEKYKEFKKLGYNIIVVWDNINCKLNKVVDKRKLYEKTMLDMGIKIVFLNYNGFDVITDNGLQPFLYSELMGEKKVFNLKTKNFSIESTENHVFFKDDYLEVQLKDLVVGDHIYTTNGLESIIDITDTNKTKPVFDLISVRGKRFFANGILVHNCLMFDEAGHVDDHVIREFWSAVKPTVSADPNARVLISSTPNGVGNLFHELWENTLSDTTWGNLQVYWYDVPGRTKEWADAERRDLGQDLFEQEYECKFLESGGSNIPEELYNLLASECRSPRVELSQFDGYRIYTEPDLENRIYVAGVDIGEGCGACNSTIQVLDVTDMTKIEQVAVYANNETGPNEFARQLNEIMKHWGKPPLAIERNNTGGGTVITLMDNEYNYPCLVNFAFKQGRVDYGHLKGITSSTNTKYYGVMNMFYFLKTHRRIKLRELETLKELNTFVRHKNERWAKKTNSYKDDRVDALIWALICVHEAVATQYFTVNMWDDNKKPFGLEPLYEVFGKKDFRNFGTEDNNWGTDRVIMPTASDIDPYIQDMVDAGWLTPEMDKESSFKTYEPSPYQFL